MLKFALVALSLPLVNPMILSADESPSPGKQVSQKLSVNVGEATEAQQVDVPYLLFLPEAYEKQPKEKWPLLLFLHGLGESGAGNLDLVKKHGPPKLVAKQTDFPFVLVSPQCPRPQGHYAEAWQAGQLIQLVDHVAKTYRVDPARIYVTGLSMGGYGAWRLAATYPERFAAALPVCGGGRTDYAPALARLPIWAFHGAKDSVVPHSESQRMIDAIDKANGNAKLTTYPNANHDSWSATYANPDIYKWLLSHRNEKTAPQE